MVRRGAEHPSNPQVTVKDFLRWVWAALLMIPLTIYVFVVGFIFYIYIRLLPTKGGGCGGGYCDHFDDLL